MVTSFLTRLNSGQPLLFDGATGTELNRRGIDTSLPLWSARAMLEAPDVLEQIQREYVAAGADVITTNTFRTHRRNLIEAGVDDRAEALTRQATQIACAAAETRNGRRVFVAGSIAPLEDCYSPELVPPDGELASEHAELARHLAEAGADFLLVETMNTIREAVSATRAARATGLTTLVSIVCDRDGNLLSGESIAAAVEALTPLQPDGLLVNCSAAPDLHKPLRQLRDSTSLPFGGYGNVGHIDMQHGWENTDAVDPDAYAGYAKDWLELGATVIGSCCGTSPDHTHALRKLLDNQEPV